MSIINKRGSYFFVLDAFIASIIIVSALAFFINVFYIKEDPFQNFLLSEDFLTFLENTRTEAYSGDVMYDLIDKGVINDTKKTLLEQVVILYDTGTSSTLANATLLLKEYSALAPSYSGINFSIGKTSLKSLYSKEDSSLAEPRINLASQRIITIVDGDELIGPYIFEVQLWR